MSRNLKDAMVTCNKCGWVHFEVPRMFAEQEVEKFNSFYHSASEETKSNYGGPVTMAEYDRCNFCNGSYKNFRKWREGDSPDGCTVGPIIDRTE